MTDLTHTAAKKRVRELLAPITETEIDEVLRRSDAGYKGRYRHRRLTKVYLSEILKDVRSANLYWIRLGRA